MRSVRIDRLIALHGTDTVEQHLVHAFLRNKGLRYWENPILSAYFSGFHQKDPLANDVDELGLDSIKKLEKCLELAIPESDRKLNGAYFTPDYVTSFIIAEVSPKECHRNLDPSCGCGAFLVGLTEYYRNEYGKAVRDTVRENIFGADILDYNIRRSKLLLTVLALTHGEHLSDDDFNLYHRDSLRADWGDNTFDNIVGNPPYVKFQDLSDEDRTFLSKRWDTISGGTFNLYFAFFELGHRLLAPDGKLGYITPNNYFTSLSGKSLRHWFQQRRCVSRIVDFSHVKVFDAQTYTAITFVSKKKRDSIVYDRIADGQSPELFLASANGSFNAIDGLNADKWRLLKSDERRNIEAIESKGMPIGKLFDICAGIATLKDDVFFVDITTIQDGFFIKETSNGIFRIEQRLVRSVHKISDFHSQEETEGNSRGIIFPYQTENGSATAIREEVFRVQFPECYRFFLSEKTALLGRDKGKVEYVPFYAWGRSQGLTRRGIRLLTPTFSRHPRFMLVTEEDAFFTNGYGVFCRAETALFQSSIAKPENLDVVQRILNSAVMSYYVTKTSVAIQGGYPCYQKNFIERFTIPDLTELEIAELRGLESAEDVDLFLAEKYQVNIPLPNLVA